ncbi:MAG TPA: tetratricopeptide repeat protein [Bacteroidota bacterium]|nr:tetratricopeptide repeat protein [Bacteroidota bacterium]
METQSSGESTRASIIEKIVLALAVIVFLLHLLSIFFPASNNWGVHLFAFLPKPLGIALSLLMLGSLLPPVQKRLINFVDASLQKWARQKTTTRILIIAISTSALASAFWIFREGTTFLGDGFWLSYAIQHIDSVQNLPTIFHNEPLSGFVVWNLFRYLAESQAITDPHLPFALFSVACGVAFVIGLFFFSSRLSNDKSDRPWVFIFVAVATGIQLFFGYVENYPPAYAGYLLFALTGILYLRGSLSLIVPSVIFAVLFAFYFGALAFVPALVLLYAHSIATRRYVIAILSLVVSVAFALGLVVLSGYSLSSFFEILFSGGSHVVPLAKTSSAWQGYTMFSSAHLVEFINLQLLLSPFALIMFAVLIFFGFRSLNWKSKEWMFIFVNACCGLIMLLIFQSDIGMSRDWDLFSVFQLSLVLGVAYLLVHAVPDQRVRYKSFLVMSIVTFIHTAGFVLVNSSESYAIPRMHTLLDNSLWGQKAYGVYEELAMHSRDRNDFNGAVAYYQKFLQYDSSNARILGNLADVYRVAGKQDSEMVYLERATRHHAQNKNVYLNLAKIYTKQSRFEEGQELFIKALMSDTPNADTLTTLGVYALLYHKDYPEALRYFDRAIGMDSSWADAYLSAGVACHDLRQYEKMKVYLTRFLQLSPDSPKAEAVRAMLEEAR